MEQVIWYRLELLTQTSHTRLYLAVAPWSAVKGQKISEGYFGVLNLSKKQTFFPDFWKRIVVFLEKMRTKKFPSRFPDL